MEAYMEKNYENNTILFVDDEDNILKSLKRALNKEPYRKLFARSGEEALKILQKEDVHVIVTDMRMPGMTGLQLLRKVKPEYPDIVKLVLSGFAQLPQVLATVNQVDIFKFITKPWEIDEFKHALNSALDYYNMKFDNDLLRASLEKKNVLFLKLLKTSDTKYSTIKKDFVSLTKFQVSLSEYFLKLGQDLSSGKMDSKTYADVVKYMIEFQKNYAGHFPVERMNIDSDYLMQDLNRLTFKQLYPSNEAKYNHEIKYIDIHGAELIQQDLRANYKVLLLVFKTLFEVMLKWKRLSEMSMRIQVLEKPNMGHIKYRFVIAQAESMYEKDSPQVEVCTEMIKSALVCLDGDFQMVQKNNEVHMIVDFEFECDMKDKDKGKNENELSENI